MSATEAMNTNAAAAPESTPQVGRVPGVRIVGTGSALPIRTVTNDDLAQIVDTSDEWISTRTGIRSRRYCDREQGESELTLARDAARRALEASGRTADEVGICLVASFTPAAATPSTACLLQRELGLAEDTLCLDVNAACAGFVYALYVAASLLEHTPQPLALVVGAEELSRVMDFSDRSTCVLFGDGAGAAVLERAADAPALTATWGSRGNDEALFAPGVGSVDEAGEPRPSYLTMDGRAVFRFATEVLPKCTSEVLQAAGVDASDVDRFVFHQANKRIVDVAVRKLGLDPARCAGNIDHTGNTSAASVPILLDELVRTGALATPARVVMAGFGAGLTWASCLVEVASS